MRPVLKTINSESEFRIFMAAYCLALLLCGVLIYVLHLQPFHSRLQKPECCSSVCPQIKEDVESTELALAFQLSDASACDMKVQPPKQPVFAFLPLRSFGFRFIVQGSRSFVVLLSFHASHLEVISCWESYTFRAQVWALFSVNWKFGLGGAAVFCSQESKRAQLPYLCELI